MNVKLLYVEDDADLRRMVQLLLLREGYEVTAVGAAEDAIVELQQHRYQALLTDFNLAHKNADWMLQVARDAGWLNDVAVLVLTATAHPEGLGQYRVLRKPVDMSVLFATLDEIVGGVERESTGPCEVPAWDGRSVMLTLYVTGGSRESKKAIRNLRRVLQQHEDDRVQLTICDVASLGDTQLERLEEDRVVVTPTLVRQHPTPRVWVFGDLSKVDAVEELIETGLEALPRA